jgi:hypothetical protein
MEGRPLKAPNEIVPFSEIDYGNGDKIVSSPKYDGNRGMIILGSLFSSSMKEPRNHKVHEFMEPLADLSSQDALVFDYEIYAPSISHHAELSGIINSDGHFLPDDFRAYVFDCADYESWENECYNTPYRDRLQRMEAYLGCLCAEYKDRFVIVEQRPCKSADHAGELFTHDLREGYEGSMLRSLDIRREGQKLKGGWWKHGRATLKQEIIWKQKLFLTVDGVITAVHQRRTLKPDWPRSYNQSGHLIRPLEKEAYVLTDMVGAFEVAFKTADGKVSFTEIGFGKGFDLFWRKGAWYTYKAHPEEFVGKWVEFEHQPHGAMEDGKLRIGRLKRFRPDLEGPINGSPD